MWQRPYRKNNANTITQSFESGVMTVYSVTNAGGAGNRPVPKLAQKVRLPYDERRTGIQRYYAAKQDQVIVQRVIRCPSAYAGCVTAQDVAITEDGSRYEVDLVQTVPDVNPLSLDVTLVKISHDLEKAEVIPDGDVD